MSRAGKAVFCYNMPLMPDLPDYVEERLRRRVPDGCCVVPGSTPVLSFGPTTSARIATVGLNPSRVEFLDGKGHELVGETRRLATLASLGTKSLADASDDALRRVVDDCETYFHRNPYCKWFKPLQELIAVCGASYLDGSACHLDLVQWATDPVWSKLPRDARTELLAADAAFLRRQLAAEPLRVLLVNSMGVWRQLEGAFSLDFEEHERLAIKGKRTSRLASARLENRVTVVAWSANLQGAFGITRDFRQRLAARVKELASPAESN